MVRARSSEKSHRQADLEDAMANVKVDLKEFEKRVNESEEAQQRFLADPIRMLEAEGLQLSDQMKSSLIRYLTAEQAARKAAKGSSAHERRQDFGLP
jgi:phosphoenolpyruvate-protein kinase (PTS system EI component)